MAGETVLAVDDREDSLRFLREYVLEPNGYKMIEARNGAKALDIILDQKIDLIISDLVMPQMGGKSLADQIRIIRPDTKVLFVSGYTDKVLAHKDILEPGVAFLHKPYSPEILIRKVHEVLKGARIQSA